MAKQHGVDMVRDDPVQLQARLDEISQEQGGKIISIMWQPARDVPAELGSPGHHIKAGYIVVFERDLP